MDIFGQGELEARGKCSRDDTIGPRRSLLYFDEQQWATPLAARVKKETRYNYMVRRRGKPYFSDNYGKAFGTKVQSHKFETLPRHPPSTSSMIMTSKMHVLRTTLNLFSACFSLLAYSFRKYGRLLWPRGSSILHVLSNKT